MDGSVLTQLLRPWSKATILLHYQVYTDCLVLFSNLLCTYYSELKDTNFLLNTIDRQKVDWAICMSVGTGVCLPLMYRCPSVAHVTCPSAAHVSMHAA